MITVNFNKGKYPVSSKKIKEIIIKTLESNGIVSEAEVDVAILSRAKMEEVNKKYYKDEIYEHPIFTFPEMENKDFTFPPSEKLYLGQMMINFDMAVETAREKNKLIDDVISELAEHGSLHLVGVHH